MIISVIPAETYLIHAGRGGAYIDGIGQSISVETVRSEWQLYTILALVLGFALYCVVDMLVGDRLRIA